jgi:hypothetical protein
MRQKVAAALQRKGRRRHSMRCCKGISAAALQKYSADATRGCGGATKEKSAAPLMTLVQALSAVPTKLPGHVGDT